ncbi:MAG TPA: leucyl/phenylalanyl-tRNA--protein transferase [Thermoanaerobaculia bacterium]|nr:leucyl/phenylalanyl-tRNA--protein transferase [Thermoanaerobaculia bacterium]
MRIPRRRLALLARPTPEGVVAIGGSPDPEMLLFAYSRGIFPWPHEGYPLLWFSPDPRFVLVPREAHLSRSLRKEMRRGTFEVTADRAFAEVMRRCSEKERPGQDGTWITSEMLEGYAELHEQGYAHSIEAWRDGRLAGGLYGVSLGRVFYGESMFADVANASKVCLATLIGNLVHWDFALLDCQSHTDHLETFGAEPWPRRRFLARLEKALAAPPRTGRWELDLGPAEAAALFGGAL